MGVDRSEAACGLVAEESQHDPLDHSEEERVRYCIHPGCNAKVKRGRCTEHERQRHQRDIEERGTAAERGYDRGWRRIRDRKLKASPLCEPCERDGRTTPATEVDHIEPHVPGEPHEWANLQSICRSCHATKTRRENSGAHWNRA